MTRHDDIALVVLAVSMTAVVPPFLPQRFAVVGHGLFLMAAGLIALSLHVVPTSDGGGATDPIFVIWFCAGLAGCIVTASRVSAGSRLRSFDIRLALIPVAVVTAVLFLHWLSNRLAGTDHPLRAHILIVGISVLVAGSAAWLAQRGGTLGVAWFAMAVIGLTIATLTTKAAVDAYGLRDDARAMADGRPFCVLTYAGREHPRMARSVLQLSRLVSRSGGRYFVEDSPWLLIRGEERFLDTRLRNFATCPTTVGGNV